MRKRKRLIVFDVGNVLVKFSLDKAARNFNRLQPSIGYHLVMRMWGNRLGRRFETGRISSRQFYGVLKRYGLKANFPAFKRAYNDIFTPVRANLDLLGELSKEHPVALLSNTNALHWKHMFENYPALKRARWRFGSHNLKAMKPEPRVYKTVARRTGTPLDSIIFIDDLAQNIRGARDLGIRGIHYKSPGQLRKAVRKSLRAFLPPGPVKRAGK